MTTTENSSDAEMRDAEKPAPPSTSSDASPPARDMAPTLSSAVTSGSVPSSALGVMSKLSGTSISRLQSDGSRRAAEVNAGGPSAPAVGVSTSTGAGLSQRATLMSGVSASGGGWPSSAPSSRSTPPQYGTGVGSGGHLSLSGRSGSGPVVLGPVPAASGQGLLPRPTGPALSGAARPGPSGNAGTGVSARTGPGSSGSGRFAAAPAPSGSTGDGGSSGGDDNSPSPSNTSPGPGPRTP